MCNKGPPFNADKMEELYEKVQMGIFERVSPIYTDELNQILDIPSVKNQCRDLDMNEIMPPQDGLLNTIKLTPNLLDLNNVLPQPKYESSQIKVRSRSVQTHRPTAFQDEAQIKGVPIRLRDRHIAPKEQDLLQAYKKADSSVGGLASPIPSSRYQAIPPREYMAPLGSRVQGTAAPHSATSKPAHMLQPYIQQPVAQPIGLASKPQLDKPPSARPGVAGYDGVLGSARPALQLANMGLRDSAKATELPLPRGGSVPIANKQVSNAPSTIVNEPKPSPQPSPAIPSQPQASQASQPLQSQRNNLSRNSARLGKEETEEAASSRRDQRMVVKQPPSYLQDLLMGGLEPRKQVGVLGVLPKSAAAPSNIHSRIGDSRVGPTLQLRQSGSRSPPQNQSESRLLNKSLARRDGSVNESLNQVVPPKPKEPGSPGIFVLNKLNIGNAALHSRFQSKLDRYAERQRSSDQSKAKEASQVLAGDSRLQLSPKAKDSSISYKNRLLGPQQQSQNGSLLRESMKRQTDEQAIQRSSAQTGQGIDLPTRTRPTDPGSILHPSFLAGIHMPTEPVARVKSVQQYEEELAKKVEEEIVKRQRKRVLLNAQSAHERYDTDGGLVNGAAIASKLLSENLSSYRSAAEPQRQRPEIESHRVLSSATKDVSTALAAQAHALASVKAATLKKHPKVISPMMGQRIGLVNQSQKTEEEVTIKRSGIQRLVPTQASANAGSNKLSLASHLVPSLDRHPTAVQPQRVNSAFHLNKKISEGNIRSPIVNNFLAKPSLASEIGVPFPKYSNRQLSEREAEELEKFNKKIDMLHVKRSQGEKSTPQMAAGIVAHYRKKPLASASKVK